MALRICTIGCGSHASQFHGPSYRKYAANYPEVELAACCDLDPEKAAAFQKQFGFARWYIDIDKMLDTEKPDAVCLIVPEHLTASISIHIMEKGYPLMMEKPPGLNPRETQRMIEAAEKHNIPNQVAFNRRYIPLMAELKKWMDDLLQKSQIHNIRYDFYRVGRRDQDFSTTAIHGVDAVRFIAQSDYQYIRFHYQQLASEEPNVANIFMDCTFESGVTAQLSFCPMTGAVMERAVVHGCDHTFLLELPIWGGVDSPGRLMHIRENKAARLVTGHEVSDGSQVFENNGFYRENVSFFQDIRAGRKPLGDLRSGRQAVEIEECIRSRAAEYVKKNF